MKKILSIVLTVILVVAIVPLGTLTAGAESYTENGYTYKRYYDAEDYVVISKYTGTNSSITIPSRFWVPGSSYADYVRSISSYAFKDNTYVKEIIVPDTIKSIGNGAFSGCSSLKTITLPFVGTSNETTNKFSAIFGGSIPKSLQTVSISSNCKKIADEQFARSFYIINVSLSGVTEIGYAAFSTCTSLKNLNAYSVTTIGDYAFINCTSLSHCGTSATSIGSYAFLGCTSLETISIRYVTQLKASTFERCENLKEVTLGTALTSISSTAFKNCPNLQKINYNGTPEQWNAISGKNNVNGVPVIWKSGSLTNGIKWELAVDGTLYLSGSGEFADLESPENTPWYNYSEYITKIVVDAAFSYIGNYRFNSCQNLENFVCDNADLTFGYYVFPENTTITINGVGGGVLEKYAKENSLEFTKLTNPTIPDTPTLRYRNANTVILNQVSGYEYSIDGENWQASTIFSGLKTGETYNFYQRIAENTYAPSQKSEAYSVSTVGAPPAPDFRFVSDNTIILNSTEGFEYSTDGKDWSASYVFNNMPYDTEITFYQRLAESDKNTVSPSSESKHCYLSSNPDIFIGESKIKIIPTDGYEYRLNNFDWQDSNVFTGLIPGKTYTIYRRFKVEEGSNLQVFYNTDGITVTMNGSDLTDSPDAETVLWIRNILLTEKNCRNFGADFNGDYTVNVKDLVNIKKTIAAQSVNLEEICDIDYTLLADTGDEIYDYKLRFNIDGSCNYTAIGYISGNSTEKTFKFTYSNYEINIYDNANTLLLTLKNNQNTSLNITYVNSSLELSGGLNRAQIFNK